MLSRWLTSATFRVMARLLLLTLLAPAALWAQAPPAGQEAPAFKPEELDQIAAPIVDAQREYYARARMGDGVQQYARRTASTPGKRDGLHWDVKPGEPLSPLGRLVASARAEGYGPRAKGRPAPYHGYYYRVLEGQGPLASGGAYAYVANGRMIGGFALIAFPAQYGVSGVTTFMVNHDGMVYGVPEGSRSAHGDAGAPDQHLRSRPHLAEGGHGVIGRAGRDDPLRGACRTRSPCLPSRRCSRGH